MLVEMRLENVAITIGTDTPSGKMFERTMVVPMPGGREGHGGSIAVTRIAMRSRGGEGTDNQRSSGVTWSSSSMTSSQNSTAGPRRAELPGRSRSSVASWAWSSAAATS